MGLKGVLTMFLESARDGRTWCINGLGRNSLGKTGESKVLQRTSSGHGTRTVFMPEMLIRCPELPKMSGRRALTGRQKGFSQESRGRRASARSQPGVRNFHRGLLSGPLNVGTRGQRLRITKLLHVLGMP